MRIESADAAAVTAAGARPGAHVRNAEAWRAQVLRGKKKRLSELHSENYHDVKIEIPPALLKGGPKAGKTVNSRRILASKKGLVGRMEDDPRATQKFLEMAARPSRYPVRPKCSICGYYGDITCLVCGARYCSLACGTMHEQARCTR